MSNQPTQIKIITVPEDQTNWQPGDEINGVVVAYPQMDAGIHSLSLELVYERRGSMSGLNRVIEKFNIVENDQWESGGEYPYKFKLILPDYNSHDFMQIGSYRGNNVNYYFNLLAKVDFDKETDKIIRAQSIKKLDIARTFFPEKGTSVTKELLISPKEDSFRLLHTETVLNPMKSSFQKWWIFVLPFLSIFISAFISSIWPFAIISSAVFAYVLFLYFFLKRNIGNVTAYIFESDAKTFSIKYNFEKSLNAVQLMNTYVEITERVVDRRGTSDTTHTATIYTSEKQEINNWDSSLEVTYDLPQDSPMPFVLGDVSLFWKTVLEMEVRFFSLIKINVPLHFIERKQNAATDFTNDL